MHARPESMMFAAYHWLLQKFDVDHWSNYLFKDVCWWEMYSNVVESFSVWIKEARHLLVMSITDTIRLQSCVMFHFYVYHNNVGFIIFVKCVLYNHVCYLRLFLCNISCSHVVSDTITFKMLVCRFKLMNMFANKHE